MENGGPSLADDGENDPIMHGLLVKTREAGVSVNPLVWIARSAARDMVRYGSEFGMTPGVSRGDFG